MIRQLKLFLLLLLMTSATMAANNSIKMAYNFTTVSQNVVFNSAMQAGGTLTFTAQATDGGGRNPGDPFTMKLVFYNSSNQVVNTVQTAFTLSLGAPLYTFTVTATNCGNSCANVAYVSVQFYGKDGGYWAGNYGPMITSPSLTFNGGSNILYNPEFGTYSGNAFAQGWTSSAGWQNCALYSGSATCVIDNGASVNGGNYSATGGSTSGTAGGYTAAPAAPSLCCGGSSASFNADTANTAKVTTFTSRTTADSKVHIEQIGNTNTIIVEQTGTRNNYAKYTGNGDSNTVSITQRASNDSQTNYVDLAVTGNSNTVDIKQRTSSETNAFGKGVFASISGNNNSLIVDQKNSGNHYAEINLSGGSKTVDLLQQGSAAHMAKITLSGQPVGLNLSQSGATQQFYSINYNCATAGGCAAITVQQGQ